MIYQILNELNESNSRLHKEAVFEKHKDNELFKRVCKMTYDPSIVYFMKKVPFEYEHDETNADPANLATALDLLDDLAARKFTGNTAIDMVREMGNSLTPTDAYVYARVIERDLDVGASEKTINKTWKKLIPEYPVMLALPDKPKNRETIKFPCYGQIKMDGTRVNMHVTEDGIDFYTRNGKPIDLFNIDLHNAAMQMYREYGEPFIIDGEALCHSDSQLGFLDRKTGNGWINRAIKKPESLTLEQRDSFGIVAWDIIPMSVFQKGEKWNKPYSERYEEMVMLFSQSFKRLSVVPTRVLSDWNEAEEFYQEAYDVGEEGLVLKNFNLHWENKRPKGCVKMKAELTAELLVVGVNEGTGKYSGKIGSLVCVSAGDNPVEVSVGSGLTDKDRDLTQDEYVGKIISVKYNEIIVDKSTGVRSLFLPIFIEVREDKDEADVL